IPLLASPQAGVAERSMKCREASADRCEAQARQRAASREAGVVFRLRAEGKPSRLRLLRWLRDILFMTQPPLLAVMQGGESRSIQIHSQVLRRPGTRHRNCEQQYLGGKSHSLAASP